MQLLEIKYSRDIESIDSLKSMRKLAKLNLNSCTLLQSVTPLSSCSSLVELSLMGDSYIRNLVLKTVGELPNLKVFKMGHYEHSDCECDLR